MAKTKEITITSIDSPWEGPIKNGNYTNYECNGTMKGMKGDESVRVIVGSEKMTGKFKAGEKYVGGFVGKTDDDRWKVAFLAKNNPSLSSSQEGYSGGSTGGSSGGSGGGSSGGQENRNRSFAVSYVKDMACAAVGAGDMTAEAAVDFTLKHAEVVELYLDGGVQKADAEPQRGVEATKSAEPTREAIGDILKRHDLVRRVGDANVDLEELKGLWDDDEEKFVANVESAVADKELPF